MMKKFSTGLFSLLLLSLAAGEWKNISYYAAKYPVQGNKQAIQNYCKLDLVTPETKNFPTLIWFHGGGLKRGVKHYPQGINLKKIAVAGVDYRLSGKNVRHPDYIYDAAAAVAWVLDNIEKYGGDPKKVYVAGHSAGGYLAAMIALDKKYLKTFGHTPGELRAFYPISGQMTTHFTIQAERRQKDPSTPELVVDEYAPLFHASKDAPPMVFFCGDKEVDWPARAEENMLIAARLKRIFKCKDAAFISIEQTGHMGCCPPSIAIINSIILKNGKTLSR